MDESEGCDGNAFDVGVDMMLCVNGVNWVDAVGVDDIVDWGLFHIEFPPRGWVNDVDEVLDVGKFGKSDVFAEDGADVLKNGLGPVVVDVGNKEKLLEVVVAGAVVDGKLNNPLDVPGVPLLGPPNEKGAVDGPCPDGRDWLEIGNKDEVVEVDDGWENENPVVADEVGCEPPNVKDVVVEEGWDKDVDFCASTDPKLKEPRAEEGWLVWAEGVVPKLEALGPPKRLGPVPIVPNRPVCGAVVEAVVPGAPKEKFDDGKFELGVWPNILLEVDWGPVAP